MCSVHESMRFRGERSDARHFQGGVFKITSCFWKKWNRNSKEVFLPLKYLEILPSELMKMTVV